LTLKRISDKIKEIQNVRRSIDMSFVDSVKEIAGKLGESVERGAKTVSSSSKKFAEKNKIKRDITHIQSDIDSDYIELGKAFFEKIGDDQESEFAPIVAEIKEKCEKIEELKAVLSTLEDRTCCSSCGAQVKKDQLYCDKCGAKLIEETIIDENEEPASEEDTVKEADENETEE